ncbi:MAG: ABC transporter ATP-binding protein [Oscillospiraceae bacterium]|nr:ABC transporter ATP-binding protein [Oscillospiraceae bacterium]
MKFIFRYLRPYAKGMLLGFSIKCFGTLIELALPYILSHIVDDVVPKDGRLWMILLWGGAMVLCALLAMLANVKANRMASRVARDGAERIRHDLFHRTMTLSASQIDAFTIPSLEARITTDTYNVHSFIGQMQRLGVRAPLLLIGGIFVTLIMDPFLSLIMLAIMPMIFGAVYLVSRCGARLYTAVQRSVDGMIRVVREDAQGIRVIKALSRVDREHERYDAVNRRLIRAEKRASLTMGFVNPVMNLLMNLGITFVVLLGAYRVIGGQTEPGRIIAFTQYFTMISNATLSVTRIFMIYTKSSASARRIAEVVDAPKDLAVRPESEFPPREGESFLVFDDVSFSYIPGKTLLQNLSFSIEKGQTLGIIGSTGSGKTTLTHLLMRFYDVNGGSVRIGGKDVRTIPEETLHSLFGVAMQNDFLYADTIRENIRFGRDLTDEAIVRAARIAQADSFISALPDGYDHVLAQKGANLSGGQKQRLLIARALAANPEILILDDSSSALDYRTDANLRLAIAKEVTGVTSVIVAQRVSSVMNADLILVLEEGRLIGAGTHAELLEHCEVYKEISDSQMGGAILD